MVDLRRTKTDEEAEREAVTGDAQVDAFIKMTPADTAAWIDDNVIDGPGDDGVDAEADGNFFRRNAVTGAWGDAFLVTGDANTLTENLADSPRDDGFEVVGAGNSFIDNTVKKAGSNGFELRGAGAFDGNSATKSASTIPRLTCRLA